MEHGIQYDQRYDTLLVVRKAASYTEAGAILSLTPSAVAHQIHSMERELNVALFQKSGKKLLPTHACDLVAEYAERVRMLSDRFASELAALKSQLQHLVVGITPSVESSALSQVLARYQSSFKGLQITVLTKSAPVLYDMLKNSAIDFAVAEGDFPADELYSVLLDTDHLVVAVPNCSPYAAQGMITVDQLQRERLILRPKGSGTRILFEANLKKMGMSLDMFNVMMEVDSVDTIKELVASDYGVSVLSNNACAADVERGKFCTVPLCDMNMIRDVHIFYHRDFRCDELIGDIRRIYAEVLQEEPVSF